LYFYLRIIGLGLILFLVGGRIWISGLIGMVIGGFPTRFLCKKPAVETTQALQWSVAGYAQPDGMVFGQAIRRCRPWKRLARRCRPPSVMSFRRVVQEMQLGHTDGKGTGKSAATDPERGLDFVVQP